MSLAAALIGSLLFAATASAAQVQGGILDPDYWKNYIDGFWPLLTGVLGLSLIGIGVIQFFNHRSPGRLVSFFIVGGIAIAIGTTLAKNPSTIEKSVKTDILNGQSR